LLAGLAGRSAQAGPVVCPEPAPPGHRYCRLRGQSASVRSQSSCRSPTAVFQNSQRKNPEGTYRKGGRLLRRPVARQKRSAPKTRDGNSASFCRICVDCRHAHRRCTAGRSAPVPEPQAHIVQPAPCSPLIPVTPMLPRLASKRIRQVCGISEKRLCVRAIIRRRTRPRGRRSAVPGGRCCRRASYRPRSARPRRLQARS